MILQYSSLRCNSDKCWLGEKFSVKDAQDWEGLGFAVCHRIMQTSEEPEVSRVRPSCFMLAVEGGFPEIKTLWSMAVKHYVLLSLSEVLTKRSQRLAETKATACSAAEISR